MDVLAAFFADKNSSAVRYLHHADVRREDVFNFIKREIEKLNPPLEVSLQAKENLLRHLNGMSQGATIRLSMSVEDALIIFGQISPEHLQSLQVLK